MNVLIVGKGGREHAIAWKIAQSKRVDHVYAAPGSPGMQRLGTCVDIAEGDFDQLAAFAKEKEIGLTIVGPEDPLADGIVDFFQDRELRIFGPTQKAARIESDKDFALDLLHRHEIPAGGFRTCTTADEARACVKEWGAPIVLKAVGLAAGKGAIVCHTEEEAYQAVDDILVSRQFGEAGDKCVVMEFLEGEEASIFGFTDGNDIVCLLPSQDHKPIGEGDTGLNTGGMGAYAPAPVVTPELQAEIVERIMVPTVQAMKKEGCPFVGVLYGGIMITDQGPKVFEFNCRLGDPETQVVLPLLKTDLLDLIEASIDGEIGNTSVDIDPRAAACVVMASGGYPGSYETGLPINGIDDAEAMGDVIVYHAGTASGSAEQEGAIITNGGRVLGVTAVGDDIPTAVGRAYQAVDNIHFENGYYRRDIGYRALDRLGVRA